MAGGAAYRVSLTLKATGRVCYHTKLLEWSVVSF